MFKLRAKKNSVTRRWLFGNLLWIVIILVIAELLLVSFVRQSYYSNAAQAINYRIQTFMNNLPSSSLETKERVASMRVYVEEFGEKQKFEMMLLNQNGTVTVTSSGFPAEDRVRPDDYLLATSSADGQGVFVGTTSLNEHVVAVTQLLSSPIGEVYAVRFMTSLENVDREVDNIALIATLAVVTILLFSLMSGIYFIRSIVLPIQKVGQSAKVIASGNFDVRIDENRRDEIGELCEQINEMAAGLSKTDRLKNEFISSVSHELRTPLTSIKGWGETLSAIGAEDKNTFQKGIRIILNETQRLSTMVEDLLDFSRMQTGRLSADMRRVDVIAELSEAVLAVEQRAEHSGISIAFDEPEQPYVILADKNRLRQVFANILDNAIKYSPPGSSIEVLTERVDGEAVISISDSGRGIPEQELPNVTKRFFKASNSTTGSGIGLAVVSEIMSLHGGSLQIESKEGQGTRVTLRFKLS